MKILLVAINAKYIHSNLAVYSLQAYAKKYKEYIKRAEYTINHRTEYILSEIYKEKPDVLCFSCYIWNIEYVRTVAGEFHKLMPQVPIWVGGPEVSYEVETFLNENLWATGIMIGEGEEIFKNVVRHYIEERPAKELAYIAGLAYFPSEVKAGKIQITKPQNVIDMNTIPFCYEESEVMGDFKNRIIYYESSRGCPFRCSYCLSSVDKRLRFRNIDLVKHELLFFMEKEVPQVKFVDRTFNCNPEHAMAVWRFIKENDRGITNFHFEIAADLLTQEEIGFIAGLRPGLIQLEIGVQTTNEATIEEIHRSMELSKVKDTVTQVKKKGNVHQHLDLIAGLPFEDYKTFAKSFDEIYALKPQQLQLGFLKVLKGSYMFAHARDYEVIYESRPPYEVLKTKWLSFDEVLKIKQVEEMLEVYYNSTQFAMTIKLLETVFGSAFTMYQRMGEFYEKKGYFAMSHSRMRRVEILLEFIEEVDVEHLAIYQEAATYDIYSRENAKSRPSWALAINEFKDISRQYCKNGKMSHLEPFTYEMPEIDCVKELPEKKNQPYFILFDYEKRDILNHEAGRRRTEG